VPTREAAHPLLAECIFPLRREGPATAHGWPFHVFHRVPNATLLESGVLCPLNPSLDESGYFDIPKDLIRAATGLAHLGPPGANADPLALRQYALSFNASVMSDERIVAFLADRIGSRLDVLGKTVVFTPNIATANRLAAVMYDKFPHLRGSVAAVHSKMAEVQIAGQGQATAQDVLRAFCDRRAKPSVLINVDMLTEGFDDPKIQTVVLARLTLSTNRFWQMIGRGTRGPACGGTHDCYVIDPIKLIRLYDYFGGYQPSMLGGAVIEHESLKPPELGLDALAPEVPSVRRPPDPAACVYTLDPELIRIHRQVAAALADFLRPMSEAIAVEAAQSARIDLTEGRPVVKPGSAFDTQVATAVLLGQIAGLEQRTGHDLDWLRRWLPHPLDEVLLRNQLRRLSAVEHLQLWTPTLFARAEMSGEFQDLLRREVMAMDTAAPIAPPIAADSPTPAAAAPHAVILTPEELATVALSLELVAASHPEGRHAPNYAQRLVIMDTLRRIFGRTLEDGLDQAIQVGGSVGAPSFDLLRAALDSGQRQTLLSQLMHLATVDGAASDAELRALRRASDQLQIAPSVMSAITGIPSTEDQQVESTIVCKACSFGLPGGACFCPGCGAAVAAG
jgi:hypothetical protein